MRSLWPLVALLALPALPACGTEYMSAGEFLHDFPQSPPDCRRGDRDCAEVNRHLDAIQATIGDWCGTPREMHMMEVRRLGARAVPTLQRALDAEGWVRPFFAADILEGMGRAAEVSAWCRANTQHENFPWICQGLNPWSLLAGAGAL